jgi:hypothetical protein
MACCSRCGGTVATLALYQSPQADTFRRYLPEVPLSQPWCAHCRVQIAVLAERVAEAVRREYAGPGVGSA